MLGIKLLIFDIDGTLIKNKSEYIDEVTIKALKEASKNGYKEIIATGRCSYFIPNIIKNNFDNADYYITINGALITNDKMETLVKHPINLDQFNKALELADKYDVALAYKFEDAVVIYRSYKEFIEIYTHGVEHPSILIDNTQNRDYHLSHGMPMGIFIIGEDDILKAMSQECNNVNWVYAYAHAMEAFDFGVSKAEAIKSLLQTLNLSPSNIMTFGDGENDIEMLELAGIGVAMGNAQDYVKTHADFVTLDCDKGGISYALKHFKIID